MGNVFISYARADAEIAERLAAALEADGIPVWIDRRGIREGDAYDRQIEEALAAASCVIVLWSQASVQSQWVRAEAAQALAQRKLVPLVIDDASLPLQFLHIHNIAFRPWFDEGDASAFFQLKRAIARIDDSVPSATQPVSASPSAIQVVLERIGLSFADRNAEHRFGVFFRERYYRQFQFVILLAAVIYVANMLTEMTDLFGAPNLNRFRAFVVTPALLGFFLVTLLRLVRPAWRLVGIAFSFVAVALVLTSLHLTQVETSYRLGGDAAVAVLMTCLGLLALLPLRWPDVLVVALAMIAVFAALPSLLGSAVSDRVLMTTLIVAMAIASVANAWFREMGTRRWFRETRS